MNNAEFFFAAQKFSEAEKVLPKVEHSAKALIMSSFCYYTINFHEEVISSLEYFLKKYPADKNIMYAHWTLQLLTYRKRRLEQKKNLTHFYFFAGILIHIAY